MLFKERGGAIRHLSSQKTAERLGIRRNYLNQLISHGRIYSPSGQEMYIDGGAWWIPEDATYDRKPPGRPRKES